MKNLALAAALLAAAAPAAAQRISKVDGNRLLILCGKGNPMPFSPGAPPSAGRQECEAYISGVADMLANDTPRRACIPTNVEMGQLRQVVLKALANHPEATQQPAARLVPRALAEAFPCRG